MGLLHSNFCHILWLKLQLLIMIFFRENMPPVLDELTFSVRGGQKIGIVGRTGRYVLFLYFFLTA